MKQVLKVLVGSRAHGLHNQDSDFDYRGVYVAPTSDNRCPKKVSNIEKVNDFLLKVRKENWL